LKFPFLIIRQTNPWCENRDRKLFERESSQDRPKVKAKKKSWEKCLCETIEEYKDTYERCMKRYYAYLIAWVQSNLLRLIYYFWNLRPRDKSHVPMRKMTFSNVWRYFSGKLAARGKNVAWLRKEMKKLLNTTTSLTTWKMRLLQNTVDAS